MTTAPDEYGICGIDEAGYGPLLGPLVVARADFVATSADEPAFSGIRRFPALRIEDSKKLLSRSNGFRHLETMVLALATAASGKTPKQVGEWLEIDRCDGRTLGEMPWYGDLERRLPMEADFSEILTVADLIGNGEGFRGVRFDGFRLAVLSERTFNSRVAVSGNKHATLFTEVVELLEEAFGLGIRRASVDRLGGRKRYGDKISASFPFIPLEILQETSEDSAYRIGFESGDVDLQFSVKGDDRFLEIAAASMAAKYTREVCMRLFNRYFLDRFEGLEPTAGYYEDGKRFLGDLADRDEEESTMRALVRQR